MPQTQPREWKDTKVARETRKVNKVRTCKEPNGEVKREHKSQPSQICDVYIYSALFHKQIYMYVYSDWCKSQSFQNRVKKIRDKKKEQTFARVAHKISRVVRPSVVKGRSSR